MSLAFHCALTMPADLQYFADDQSCVCISLGILSPTNMPGIHTNPDVIDNSALTTAWHVAGLPRVARECVPIATRLTTLFATLKCSEGFAKRQKGITAEICHGRKCVEWLYDF